MPSPNQSPLQTTNTMAKPSFPGNKPSSILTDSFLFVGGATVSLLLVWAFGSFINPNPNPNFPSTITKPKPIASEQLFTEQPIASEELFTEQYCSEATQAANLRDDSSSPTFYDDPNLSYSIEKPIKNWDEKRRDWLNNHPSFIAGTLDRILLVTGSQSTPCRNPIGDHVLLRFFKNKVDYCRIHGYDIFYNNALFHPKMSLFWAKIPLIRAAMIAHPEAEWIWWVDSDAAFTDMEFKLPLDRYRDHNLIVHGWAHLIYEKKSWVALNAGVFLIRNCQWSMDFMDVWASMGPQTPKYDTWSKTLKSTFKDKVFNESCDQSALVYLLLKEKEKWADKIYLESEYYFEGYWVEIVGTLTNITDKYIGIETRVRELRRRHAEKVSEYYGTLREPYLKEAGYGSGSGSWRRPFITHFAGCQPCSGDHNQMFSGESCWSGMQRALNFADNQVLRSFGFVHRDLLDSSSVSPLPFDFPA